MSKITTNMDKAKDFHKGKISLESKKGSGTKFYINIKTLTNENK